MKILDRQPGINEKDEPKLSRATLLKKKLFLIGVGVGIAGGIMLSRIDVFAPWVMAGETCKFVLIQTLLENATSK